MLDTSSFEAYVPNGIRPRIQQAWIDEWKAVRPSADPARAEASSDRSRRCDER